MEMGESKIHEPVVKSTDMSEEMQQDAFEIANEALSKFKIEKVSYRAVDKGDTGGYMYLLRAKKKFKNSKGSQNFSRQIGWDLVLPPPPTIWRQVSPSKVKLV
jgi:hypothetical protein